MLSQINSIMGQYSFFEAMVFYGEDIREFIAKELVMLK
jgi:hypothetical protein